MNTLLPLKCRNGYGGIYIHYPYCVHKCAYCDFYSAGIGLENSGKDRELFSAYITETDFRIRQFPELQNLIYDTVFFGGGTPSKADPLEIYKFLYFLKNRFQISENAEITVECNPEDLSTELLKNYFEIGITRINAGVQSFSPIHLQTLDRHFRGEKYDQILEALKNSRFTKKGIDLMYGIPGQTLEDFFSDIRKAAENGLTHISAYSLTAEKGTEYYRKIRSGKSLSPNEELQSEILFLLPDLLSEFKYRQYEVSNYSIAGFESFHNLKYWLVEEYLGICPGAHGFIGLRRYSNDRSTDVYLKKNWNSNFEISDSLTELALCIFRIFIPIELNGFLEKFAPEKKDSALKLIKKWKTDGYCRWENGIFEWNKKSVQYLDDRISEIAGL